MIFIAYYFFPNRALSIMLPSLRSTPARDVGMPVSRAMRCFACVMPRALFHEKESPGMPVLDLRRAIFGVLFVCYPFLSFIHKYAKKNISP